MTVSFSSLSNNSHIPESSSCEEQGCRIQLDGMPQRAIFHPDLIESTGPRADCCIFFPESEGGNSTSLFRHGSGNSNPEAKYLAIIELKNTVNKPTKIKSQLSGALEEAIELLESCDSPTWGIRCFFLVVKKRVNRYSKPIQSISIRKNINGQDYRFRPIPVDSGESVRDLLDREDVQDILREI